MPNHYHFLLKQLTNNGIKTFMANISNSVTRYFNLLKNRKGPVFLTQLKSKQIKNMEQLIYTSKYIHTNPYAGKIIERQQDTFTYRYSSINAYINPDNNPNKINLQTQSDCKISCHAAVLKMFNCIPVLFIF